MFTSRIWAPPSTCRRATSTASSKRSSSMSVRKRRDPVTFVRSPTFTKLSSGVTFSGSSPDSRQTSRRPGTVLGATPSMAAAISAMCPGVVPQHPPTRFRRPLLAKSPISPAISPGPWS